MLDGSDLKSVRKNAGISQTDMAKKLDCDRRTIINYEQGVCEPKTSQLFRWLSVCKIDLKPLAAQLQGMKNSILILFTIAYFTPDIMMSSYVAILGLFLVFGIIRKSSSITFAAVTLLLTSLLEYTSLQILVSFLAGLENKTAWHSSSIFLSQSLLSFFALIIFINQKRIIKCTFLHSWKHSYSYSLVLTMSFAYFTALTAAAAVEFILNRQYAFKNFNFIYTYYESLVYFGWAVVIATLITMALEDLKQNK
ncbi:hypothetical protein CWB96_17845 [Pseudoalteromonas citrea]|uniref:HTH cro/C1-type domain-containing protein n=1 Tax=Pseudoalteromonas citrea TaxID=43655 RepID=A0A5S3XK56_9GAMM|nr:helix-turn-helix transcriptional regulator [Pseudoalteromonas citrea]TMP42279.1 hypothetical protein CWB97_12195 [Pseudoalteromonas citrea]TMP55153.1 hypothetical protein CWB96_17845 [Pseudoalteromonas citrea]